MLKNKEQLEKLFNHDLKGDGETINELKHEYNEIVNNTGKIFKNLYEKEQLIINSELLKDFNNFDEYIKYLLKKGTLICTTDNTLKLCDDLYIKYYGEISKSVKIEETKYLKEDDIIEKFIAMVLEIDYKTKNIDSSFILNQIEQMELKCKSKNEFIVDLNSFASSKLSYALDIVLETEYENEQKKEREENVNSM